MKAGTENRRKTMIAGGLGSLALIYAIYTFGGMFFGGSSPAPTPPPPTVFVERLRSHIFAGKISLK